MSRVRWIAVVAGVAVLAASCGGDNSASTATTTAATTAAATSAPAATTAPPTTAASSYPLTVQHALGTTEIPARPERVVAVGYGEGDIVAALGIVPVAINGYGPNRSLPTPWFDDAVEGADVELLDTAQGLQYERIAALRPDVILAVTSDIDASEYALLSDIAPTVAYVTGPYQDSWQDAALLAGRVLGEEAKAQALVDGVGQAIEDAAAAHPGVVGHSVSVVLAISPDQVGVLNSPKENTIRTLTELGMQLPPAVSSLAIGPTGYSAVISLEEVGVLDADVLLMYAINDEARSALTSNGVFAGLPVNRRGDVLPIEPAVWAALRNPSVLAIPYALDALVGPIETAVTN